MKWAEASEQAISRVPFFLRKQEKKRVEKEAARCGAQEVSIEHVRICNNNEKWVSEPYTLFQVLRETGGQP